MDTYQRTRNDTSLNPKNSSRPTYIPSKSPEMTSSLLPAFVSQSRNSNSHLPTPQRYCGVHPLINNDPAKQARLINHSPSTLQFNNYLSQSQESPDARYFVSSSRPGSVNPPRHGITSYPKHAIVTPSPELSLTQLPSNDILMTPTPKPKPTTTATAEHKDSRSYSPGLSSIYQSSPDHPQHTHPQSKRHQRQRTMSIDEPATPILNLNLALARHASGVVQQSSKHDTDHEFDPDDPFIERADVVIDGSVPGLREGHGGEGAYRKADRNDNAPSRRRSASPSESRAHEGIDPSNEPKYSETPTGESWYSSPAFSSSSARPLYPREAATHHHPRRTESPLTPCPVTPPPVNRSSVNTEYLHSRTPSPRPLQHKYTTSSQPITPPSRNTQTVQRTSSSSSPIPGGELTRIKAHRARLEEERAAASEPRRPDYLVRVQHDATDPIMARSEHMLIPEPERLTPVKRRDMVDSVSSVKRKRAKLENDIVPAPEGVDTHDSQSGHGGSGLGIIVTPTRGRRLTLYQPKPRMQNAGVNLGMIAAAGGENDIGKEEPRTPPPFSHPLTRPPPISETVSSSPTPPMDSLTKLTTAAPYTLAMRSINWHTPPPRSSRGFFVGSSSFSSLPSEDNEALEAERRRRLAIKERRLAAFCTDKQPSSNNKKSRLRPFELAGRGRIVIDCGDEDVGDLVEVGVVTDTIPHPEPNLSPPTEPGKAELSNSIRQSTTSTIPDWPDHLYPWSTASQNHAQKTEQERLKNLAYIERYFDRESESESEEDLNPILGHAGGMGLVLVYDALAKTGSGEGGKKGSSYSGSVGPVLRSGRTKMVALSDISERVAQDSSRSLSTKGPKTGGSGGGATRGNRGVKKPSNLHATSQNTSTTATPLRHLILPTSTADARLALLSRKRVRLLAEKLRKREEEGVVMCICQGGDDGRAMVRCDRCRVWYHLVCVDVRDPDELGEEWFCFKCVGEDDEDDDDDQDEEGEEEGTLNGDEEEEEEPGVSVALNRKARTQILHASNASVNVKLGANGNVNVKSRKKQQQHRVSVDSKQPVKPRAKPRQKQRQAKQQQQQKVPDFAPAMPESPIRTGVGDQMLFQHHQTFPLQPSPMPPSPVRRKPTPGRRHALSSNSSISLPLSSSSSSHHSRHHSYPDITITNDNIFRSPSRSPSSRDRNGISLINYNYNNDASSSSSSNLSNSNSHFTAPSTPRRSKPFTSSSSSPTKLGFPPVYLTPKLSYDDDAPFDPTSTPSRGLKFYAPTGPITPISSSRNGHDGSGSTFGRYGYGYGYGGFGFGSGSSGSGGGFGHSSLMWGTPHTPTNVVGAGRGGELNWSGWGDESPVRRKKPVDTAPPAAPNAASSSSSSASSSTFISSTVNSNYPRRNATLLLDSPILIGPSTLKTPGSRPLDSNLKSTTSTAATTTTSSGYLAAENTVVEESPPISSSRDSPFKPAVPGPGKLA